MGKTEDKTDTLRWLLEQKVTELHVLFNIGTMVGESLRKADLLARIWPFLKDSLSLSALSVYDLNDEEGDLVLVFTSKTGQAQPHMPKGEGVPWAAANTGRPLIIPDASKFDGFLHYPAEKRSGRPSLIAVPLKAHDKVTGVLVAERKTRRFKGDDVDLVTMMGLLVAIGLEKCELFEKTEKMSLRDGLTGLYNHRVFVEKLHEEAERMHRTRRPVCLVMMDIDDFKRVNDTYGHVQGDAVLAEMSAVISSQIRNAPTDILARYGGEEFALILVEASLDQALVVAERIRKAVEWHDFAALKSGGDGRMTISVGVSESYYREDCEAGIVGDADKALYHSKINGKNKTSYVEGGRLILVEDVAE
jgi:diguanylate cyclase (GGDEF)-like protein